MDTLTGCVIKYGYQNIIDFIVSLYILENFMKNHETINVTNTEKENIIRYIANNIDNYQKYLDNNLENDKIIIERFTRRGMFKRRFCDFVPVSEIKSISIFISNKYGSETYDKLIEETE